MHVASRPRAFSSRVCGLSSPLGSGIEDLLFWVTPCNRPNRFATGASSVRMGEGEAACAILNSAWVTSWGGQSGDRGGGGQLGHGGKLSFFLMSRRLFLWKRCREGENKSDLKNCNASWSLCHGHLARETLTIKWCGLVTKCCIVRYHTQISIQLHIFTALKKSLLGVKDLPVD
jgi:hypothetical protein